MSQRKSIIAAEEAPPGSPLRRSSRIAVGSPAPAPLAHAAPVTRRRSSASLEQAAAPAKAAKTKRLSLSEEVEEPKRPTRSRAGSKSPMLFESKEKTPSISSRKGRRSSITEIIEEENEAASSPKPITLRRSSRGRSSSPTNVSTEQPAKPRTRRGSVTEKIIPLDVIDESESSENEPARQRIRSTRAAKIDTIEENQHEDSTPTKVLKVNVSVTEEQIVQKAIVKARYSNSPVRLDEIENKSKSPGLSTSSSLEDEGNKVAATEKEHVSKERKLSESVKEDNKEVFVKIPTVSLERTKPLKSESMEFENSSTEIVAPVIQISGESSPKHLKRRSPRLSGSELAKAEDDTAEDKESKLDSDPNIVKADITSTVARAPKKSVSSVDTDNSLDEDFSLQQPTSPVTLKDSSNKPEESMTNAEVEEDTITKESVVKPRESLGEDLIKLHISPERRSPRILFITESAKKLDDRKQFDIKIKEDLMTSPHRRSLRLSSSMSPKELFQDDKNSSRTTTLTEEAVNDKKSVENINMTQDLISFDSPLESKQSDLTPSVESDDNVVAETDEESAADSEGKVAPSNGTPKTTFTNEDVNSSEDEKSLKSIALLKRRSILSLKKSPVTPKENNLESAGSARVTKYSLTSKKISESGEVVKETNPEKTSGSTSKDSSHSEQVNRETSDNVSDGTVSPLITPKKSAVYSNTKCPQQDTKLGKSPRSSFTPKKSSVSKLPDLNGAEKEEGKLDSSENVNVSSPAPSDLTSPCSEKKKSTNDGAKIATPKKSLKAKASDCDLAAKITSSQSDCDEVKQITVDVTESTEGSNLMPKESLARTPKSLDHKEKTNLDISDNVRILRSSLTPKQSPVEPRQVDAEFKSPKTAISKKSDSVQSEEESDGSLCINISLPASTDSQEKWNVSSGSDGSDKENVSISSAQHRLSVSDEVKGLSSNNVPLTKRLSASAGENISISPRISVLMMTNENADVNVEVVEEEGEKDKKSVTPNKHEGTEEMKSGKDISEGEIMESFVDELKDDLKLIAEAKVLEVKGKKRKSINKRETEVNTSTPDDESRTRKSKIFGPVHQSNLSQSSDGDYLKMLDKSLQSQKTKKSKNTSTSSKETDLQVVKNPEGIETTTSDSTELNRKLVLLVADKMKDYESADSNDDGEEDENKNNFLDDEASEGEEDTPSEGSNDIIEHGEILHSSDTDDDSYDDEDYEDSFVDDDEDVDLLSGEEFDLGDGKREEPEVIGKKKMSRIISIADDSDSEDVSPKDTSEKKKSLATVVLDSEDEDRDAHKIKVIQDIKISPKRTLNKQDNLQSLEVIKLDETTQDDGATVFEPIILTTQTPNNSFSDAFSHTASKRKTSISFTEHIQLDRTTDSEISEKITKVVDLLCSSIKEKSGKVSLNVSLDYATNSNSSDDVQSVKAGSSKDSNVVTVIDVDNDAEMTKGLENLTPRKEHIRSKSRQSGLIVIDDDDLPVRQRKSGTFVVSSDKNSTLGEDAKNSVVLINDEPLLRSSGKKNKSGKILIEDETSEKLTEVDQPDTSRKSKKKKKSRKSISDIKPVCDDTSDSVENRGFKKRKLKHVDVNLDFGVSLEHEMTALDGAKASKKKKKNKQSTDDTLSAKESKAFKPMQELKKKTKRHESDEVERSPTEVDVTDSLPSKKSKKKKNRSSPHDSQTSVTEPNVVENLPKLKKKKGKKDKSEATTSNPLVFESELNDDVLVRVTKTKKQQEQEPFQLESAKELKVSKKKRKLLETDVKQPDEIPKKIAKKSKKSKQQDSLTPSTVDYLPTTIIDEIPEYKPSTTAAIPPLKTKRKPKHKHFLPDKGDQRIPDWNVRQINETLPSLTNESSTNVQLQKITSKLPANDFKNRMLYDSKRVKRTDSKKIIKNKESSSFKG